MILKEEGNRVSRADCRSSSLSSNGSERAAGPAAIALMYVCNTRGDEGGSTMVISGEAKEVCDKGDDPEGWVR